MWPVAVVFQQRYRSEENWPLKKNINCRIANVVPPDLRRTPERRDDITPYFPPDLMVLI